MIEGLLIEIKSDELVTLFTERAKRADGDGKRLREAREKLLAEANVKLDQADNLFAEIEETDFPGLIADRREIGLSNLKGALRNLGQKIENADVAAKRLRFIAAHLVKGETYRLHANDLGSDYSMTHGPVMVAGPRYELGA